MGGVEKARDGRKGERKEVQEGKLLKVRERKGRGKKKEGRRGKDGWERRKGRERQGKGGSKGIEKEGGERSNFTEGDGLPWQILLASL